MPAPGPLRVVQEFVNTVDIEAGGDDLDSPQRLHDWLAGHELLPQPATVSGDDLERAHALRRGLRSLLLANDGEAVEEEAVAGLNRLASAVPLVVRFQETGAAALEPREAGVDGAIARVLAIVVAAMEEGTWQRLKLCREHTCRWAFYDTSRNRSGTWCSMAVCGNRNKARAYRRRRRP